MILVWSGLMVGNFLWQLIVCQLPGGPAAPSWSHAAEISFFQGVAIYMASSYTNRYTHRAKLSTDPKPTSQPKP